MSFKIKNIWEPYSLSESLSSWPFIITIYSYQVFVFYKKVLYSYLPVITTCTKRMQEQILAFHCVILLRKQPLFGPRPTLTQQNADSSIH